LLEATSGVATLNLRRFLLAAIVAALALAGSGSALALDPTLDVSQYIHTSWRIRDGFATGRITALAQTPDGYLWLGTTGGVYRFDGVRAVRLSAPEGNTLPHQWALALAASSDGRLWIGTLRGLASWKDGQLTRYPELDGSVVNGIATDPDGTVWALGRHAGEGKLCSFRDPSEAHCDRFPAEGEMRLLIDKRGTLWIADKSHLWRWGPGLIETWRSDAQISALAQDPSGDSAILVGTGSGVREISGQKNDVFPLPGAPQSFVPNSFLQDRSGALWIASFEAGILHRHGESTDVFGNASGLSSDQITGFLEDREGDVWVATVDGLDRFRDPAIATFSTGEGLSNALVTSTLEATDGSLWFGTLDGIDRWKNHEITVYRNETDPSAAALEPPRAAKTAPPASLAVRTIRGSEIPGGSVLSLFQDSSGRVWVSAALGLAYFQDERFVPVTDEGGSHIVKTFAQDPGGIWLSRYDRGLVHVTDHGTETIPWEQLGKRTEASTMVADTALGGLWLGFFEGGVVLLKDGQVDRSFTAKDGLGDGRVGQLRLDPDGTLWAATEGGLSRIRGESIATLSGANGLPCDGVVWMLRDDDGSYWLDTVCGLLRIGRADMAAWIADRRHKVEPAVFDVLDGVRIHPEYWTGGSPNVVKARDGRIWFLSIDGVSMIDPRHIATNTVPPPVQIEQVTADDQTYGPVDKLALPSRIRDLTIDYTALSLAVPEKVHFRVKLEGQDKEWRELVNERRVHYSNLAPGDYRFRVTASNNSGVWNEEGAALAFSIAPAYWQTLWFRAAAVAAAIGLLVLLYRLRLRQLEQAGAIERRQHALEMELAHANRVALMGQLTASIAHEVNQPLSATYTNAQSGQRWLKADPPAVDELRKIFERIVRDVDRASAVIGRVRNMVKRAPEHREDLSLNDIVTEMVAIARVEAMKQGVAVTTELDPDLPAISGDRIQLQQVLLNLLMNASEAMQENTGPREIVVRTEALSGGEVQVSVRDTGPGLLPETREKVFQSFYTTKPSGMGMGLAICRTIIEAHGGKLSAGANQPRGAVFQFTAPSRSADAARSHHALTRLA
jgi:signal transduction histidine kinase/ligand-binding sensor domain-containing protein